MTATAMTALDDTRVWQRAAFFHPGVPVEANDTEQLFTNPEDERTEGYITRRFGRDPEGTIWRRHPNT